MGTRVAIIGAGNFGSAIAHLLQDNHDVRMWDADEERLPFPISIDDAVRDASLVVFCVPSWALRDASALCSDSMRRDAIVLSASKGVLKDTLETTDQVLAGVFGKERIGLLYGPMLAAEIMEGKPSFGVLAASDRGVYEAARSVFQDSGFHMEYSDDVRGVALAGVMKNVYALGLGMLDAMDIGSNTQGMFMKKACEEMASVLEMLGGSAKTAYSAAGLGDLAATGSSSHSRNYTAGRHIIDFGEARIESEGQGSVSHVMSLAGDRASSFPLMSLIYRVVRDGSHARQVISEEINRGVLV